MATMAIANRARSAIFKSLVVFTKSAKYFDLAIKKEKIITKQKSLATCADGNEKFPCLPYLP